MRSILLMGVIVLTRLGGTFLAFILLARLLSLSDFGTFVSGYSLAMIAAVAVDYGFAQSLLRDVGADRDGAARFISDGLRVKFILSVFAIASAPLLAAWFFPEPEAAAVFFTLVCFSLFSSYAEYFGSALRALGNYHEEAIIQLVCTLGMFAGMIAGGYADFSMTAFAAVLAASKLVQLIVLLAVLVNYVRLENVMPRWNQTLAELRRCMPYAADQGACKLLDNVDVLLVSHALGPAAAGIYQAGQKLMLGFSSTGMILSNVFLPRLSFAVNRDESRFKALAIQLAALMSISGLISWLVFAANPEPLVAFVFGQGFSALAPLMPQFGVLLMLRYIAGTFAILLTALGMQSTRLFANLIGLTLVLTTAIWLIDKFGISGMVYAQIASVIVLAVIYAAVITVSRSQPETGATSVAG
jgi:O-antigen/teichoic acid export membrane protein